MHICSSLRSLTSLEYAKDLAELVCLDALACLGDNQFTWCADSQFAGLPDKSVHCLEGEKE